MAIRVAYLADQKCSESQISAIVASYLDAPRIYESNSRAVTSIVKMIASGAPDNLLAGSRVRTGR